MRTTGNPHGGARRSILLFSALLIGACGGEQRREMPATDDTVRQSGGTTAMKQDTFELGGGAFQSGEMIPSKYTCDGENISPSLAWHGAPPGTKYFALIVDDPDAPSKTWVHWVLYDIPAALNNLPEAADQHAIGARGGRNDFGKTTYGGPCPPGGSHHYHFKLYALDAAIGGELDKEGLLKAMQGHVLATTELIGLYARRQ